MGLKRSEIASVGVRIARGVGPKGIEIASVGVPVAPGGRDSPDHQIRKRALVEGVLGCEGWGRGETRTRAREVGPCKGRTHPHARLTTTMSKQQMEHEIDVTTNAQQCGIGKPSRGFDGGGSTSAAALRMGGRAGKRVGGRVGGRVEARGIWYSGD